MWIKRYVCFYRILNTELNYGRKLQNLNHLAEIIRKTSDCRSKLLIDLRMRSNSLPSKESLPKIIKVIKDDYFNEQPLI